MGLPARRLRHLDLGARRRISSATARLVSDHVRAAVETCASYLGAFWDQPCYDWWEEHADGVHPSTLGADRTPGCGPPPVSWRRHVHRSAGRRPRRSSSFVLAEGLSDGHLVKTVGAGPRVDASLVACATPFGLVPPAGPVADATYAAVVDQTSRPTACTATVATRSTAAGAGSCWPGSSAGTRRPPDASTPPAAAWNGCTPRPTRDGLLPEQVTTHALDPTFIAAWAEQRWGPVATPLLWSHAMYITLADALRLLDD